MSVKLNKDINVTIMININLKLYRICSNEKIAEEKLINIDLKRNLFLL